MSRAELLFATALLVINLIVVEWVVYALATGQLGSQVDERDLDPARVIDRQP